jgi:hypothetical protein
MTSIPIQTNINVDTTFYSQVPPVPPLAYYSTATAQQWISTANLIVDTINGTAPNDIGPLSSLTAGIFLSTPQAYISTLNGAPPISSVSLGPDPLLSTFMASNFMSTTIMEVGEINSALPILVLTLPPIVNNLTSPIWMSTQNIAGGEISSISSTTLTGKGPGAALGGGMSISTPTLSTVSINSNNLSTNFKYFPGPIISGQQATASGTYSTIIYMPYVFPGDYAVVAGTGTLTVRAQIISPSSFIFHSFQTLPVTVWWLAAGACGPSGFS